MIDVLFIGSAPAHCPNATNFPILRSGKVTLPLTGGSFQRATGAKNNPVLDVSVGRPAPAHMAHSCLSSSVVRDFNLRTSTKRGLHVGTYDGFARVRVSPDLHLFT
jgi:hypothetical protein